MKRIQTQKSNYLSQFGVRMFLQPSSNNYALKIIAPVSQYLLFTLMVSSQYIQTNPFHQVLSATSIIIFLMIMFLIRYLFKVVVTKFFYLPIILWTLSNQAHFGLKVTILILLGLHIIVDLLNQIQFQFTTQNPYSQTINQTKITHYLVLIISSILRIYAKTLFASNMQWMPESISIALFFAQAYIKLNSRMKSFLGKQLLIRFYFLSLGYFIKNIAIIWVNNVNLIYQHLLVLVTSQVLSTVLIEKYNKIQVDYDISNGNIVNLVFAILSYHFGSVYDPKLQQIARQFCSQSNNQASNLQNQHIMNTISLPKTSHLISDLKSHSNVQKKRQVSKNFNIMRQIMQGSKKKEKIAFKAEQLLDQSIQHQTDNPISCIFLIAQIKFHVYEHIIVAKLIIDKLKQEIPWYYLIKKLCIYKFQSKVKKQIENKYNISKLDNFQQFFSNQKLRILIIKHSYQYLSMWKYIMTEDFLFKKLAYLLSKLLQKTQKIKNYFQSLVYKCSTIVYLYIEYLYVVRRDIPEALNNCQNYQINKQVQSFFNVENKIYLSLDLEKEQIIRIENISYNVKKLLGYDRFTIKNSSLSIFLPSFFAEAHEKITSLAIKSQNQNLYLFKKNVYVKHFQRHYLPARLEFKMVYNRSGQLLMQGFMEIIQDTVYDWPNYFVIKSEQQQIIEVGGMLKQFIQLTPHKFVHCNEFFQNNVVSAISIITQSLIPGSSANIHAFTCGMQRKYFFQNGTNFQYHLMRQIKTQSINYCYYVCQTKIINIYEKFNSEQEIRNRQVSQYIDQYYQYQKYPTKFVDFQTNLQTYFQQRQEIIKKINNRIPNILFAIAISVFLISSALQAFLVQRVRTTRQTNKNIMIDMDNLVEFYHNLQNLGVMLKRTSFKVNKGKIFYYDHYNVITVCLAIQSKNQLLAKFGHKKYMEVGDQAIKNPKPLKQLISDLVSNYFPVFYYTDPQIVLSCRHNVHTFFRYVWSDALLDYLTVYLASVEKVVDQDNKIKIGVGICIGVLMVIIYILMIKIDNYQRGYQYECLNLISSINCSHIFINSINQFLRNAVGSFSQRDLNQKDNKQSFHASFLSRFETNSNISARQNSIRGLFQQDFTTNGNRQMQNFTSKNNTILNTLQVKEKAQFDQTLRKQQKTRPRSKVFILLWTFGGTNLISDQASNQVKLSRSVKNMLVLLDKQIRFSTIIVCYLDFIAFSFPQDLFILSYNSYKSVQNEEVAFQQVGYKQFKNFTQLLQNYMNCDPKYKDSLNIPYYSAIHKLNTFMIDNINVSLSDQIVLDQLQFLFYAHYLIQGTFYKLIKTYMSDYTEFQISKYNTLYVFYYCQIVSFVLYLFITLILYCRNFKKKQKDCKDILNLIIKQSYNTKQQPQQ